MSFEDEIDHDEHASITSSIANEHRSENGQRIEIVVEFENIGSATSELDKEIAYMIRDTLIHVAEALANFQPNPLVRSNIISS